MRLVACEGLKGAAIGCTGDGPRPYTAPASSGGLTGFSLGDHRKPRQRLFPEIADLLCPTLAGANVVGWILDYAPLVIGKISEKSNKIRRRSHFLSKRPAIAFGCAHQFPYTVVRVGILVSKRQKDVQGFCKDRLTGFFEVPF